MTTAPARCGWSATAPACGWRTGCPAATSTRTSASPACSPAACTASSNELALEPAFDGNAYESDKPHVPRTLREARDAVRRARRSPATAFGDDVVDHYVNARRRRAGRVQRRGDRLGAVPGVRAAVSVDDTRMTSSTRPPRRSSPRSARPAAGDRPGDRARARRPSSLAGGRARPTGPGCCAASPTAVDAHVEELARLEVRNAGHTIGNARWEAGNVRDVLDVLLRRARNGCSGRQIPVAGRDRRHVQRAARRRRRDRAVELPDADRRLGLRAGAGRRQHRRPQAGRADPADRAAARRAGAGGRAARGRVHGPARQGLGGRASASSTHPAVRKVCFTGSTEVGKRIMARLRRPGEAGHARARRQERQHRVRRRRPRAGGRDRAVRASSTTPARTAAPAAGSWSSAACTTASWSCSSPR